MHLKLIILLICCISWTIAYVECIRVAFRDKAYTMPFIALALNVTWEAYYTYKGISVMGWYHVSTIFDAIWLLLDCMILYTYLKYGNITKMSHYKFITYILLVLILALGYQHCATLIFGPKQGGLYSSMLMNLVMSILFIKMYFDRNSLNGQSLSIAVFKCLGTFAATILVGVVGVTRLGGVNPAVIIIGIIIFILDTYYVYKVYSKSKTALNPDY